MGKLTTPNTSNLSMGDRTMPKTKQQVSLCLLVVRLRSNSQLFIEPSAVLLIALAAIIALTIVVPSDCRPSKQIVADPATLWPPQLEGRIERELITYSAGSAKPSRRAMNEAGPSESRPKGTARSINISVLSNLSFGEIIRAFKEPLSLARAGSPAPLQWPSPSHQRLRPPPPPWMLDEFHRNRRVPS